MSDQSQNDFIEVCKSFDNAMLVTHDAEGDLVARPMMVAQIEANGDLWFASDQNSAKVDEILSRPEVCVTMAGGGQYASITGKAEVIKDQSHIDRLWTEPWRVWFPEGPHDPRIVLIRIHASAGEFWSNAGANRIKYLFEAAKAYMTGRRPSSVDNSQHSRVELD